MVKRHFYEDILDGNLSELHTSASYIIRKQLLEADSIVINETDLISDEELYQITEKTKLLFPLAKIYCISAKTGEGINEWLEDNLSAEISGSHLAEVDYDIYAEGEAVLGWLNASLTLDGAATDWNQLMAQLMNALGTRFDNLTAAVGHIKVFLQIGNEYLIGNITGKTDTLQIRGGLTNHFQVKMTLNARVQMRPDELENIVRDELSKGLTNIHYHIDTMACLQPGRPNPTYRYAESL